MSRELSHGPLHRTVHPNLRFAHGESVIGGGRSALSDFAARTLGDIGRA